MIWLSRQPTDAPSASQMLMWYGPPEIDPAPTPTPQPRGPVLAAMWPPKRSMTLPALERFGTEYVTMTCASSSPDPLGSSWVGTEIPVIVPPYIVMTWPPSW